MRHFYKIIDKVDDGEFLLEDSTGNKFHTYLFYLNKDWDNLIGKNISVSYLEPSVYQAIDPKIENDN